MKIRIGYELVYDCPQPTPMILTLSVHYTRVSDMIIPDHMIANPPVPVTAYRDSFGNWCSRIIAPKGLLTLSNSALIRDSGLPDIVVPGARQTPVTELPDETLMFLLGSRPLLRDRSPVGCCLEPVRPVASGLGAGPGDLRLRAWAHHFRLRACPQHQDGFRGFPGAGRGVS